MMLSAIKASNKTFLRICLTFIANFVYRTKRWRLNSRTAGSRGSLNWKRKTLSRPNQIGNPGCNVRSENSSRRSGPGSSIT